MAYWLRLPGSKKKKKKENQIKKRRSSSCCLIVRKLGWFEVVLLIMSIGRVRKDRASQQLQGCSEGPQRASVQSSALEQWLINISCDSQACAPSSRWAPCKPRSVPESLMMGLQSEEMKCYRLQGEMNRTYMEVKWHAQGHPQPQCQG